MAPEEIRNEVADPRFDSLCAKVVKEMERLHVPRVVVWVRFGSRIFRRED